MDAPTARPTRALIIVLGLIAVLVVVAVLAVFMRGEPRQLDASTPEGVVQRYSAAVIEGDEAAAAAYLSQQARAGCEDIEHAFTGNLRVTLVSTVVRADSADVRVSVAVSTEGGLFGASDFETEDVFDLRKTEGTWLVDTAPWQLQICVDKSAKP